MLQYSLLRLLLLLPLLQLLGLLQSFALRQMRQLRRHRQQPVLVRPSRLQAELHPQSSSNNVSSNNATPALPQPHGFSDRYRSATASRSDSSIRKRRTMSPTRTPSPALASAAVSALTVAAFNDTAASTPGVHVSGMPFTALPNAPRPVAGAGSNRMVSEPMASSSSGHFDWRAIDEFIRTNQAVNSASERTHSPQHSDLSQAVAAVAAAAAYVGPSTGVTFPSTPLSLGGAGSSSDSSKGRRAGGRLTRGVATAAAWRSVHCIGHACASQWQ